MRDIPLLGFLSRCCHGFPLFFGGGAAAPPAPPVPIAPTRADPQAASDRSNMSAKRRIGGADAFSGNVLGSLAKTKTGMTSTLGGSASAYTGEA